MRDSPFFFFDAFSFGLTPAAPPSVSSESSSPLRDLTKISSIWRSSFPGFWLRQRLEQYLAGVFVASLL